MAEAPETQGRPLFKIDQVGKFDPCKDDARSWLSRYEYFGSVSATSAELLAKFFGMFLSMGAAFDWFTCLNPEIKQNFELLKAKFLQRFSKRIDPIQITSELFQMKQKTTQSVRDFVYSVQTKARQADIHQDNVLSAINSGLLSHIRADLRRNPPKTLDELIETAEQSESAYAEHPPQLNFSEATFTEIIKNAIGGVNMVELKQQVESLAANQKSVNSFTTRDSNTYRPQNKFREYSKKGRYQTAKAARRFNNAGNYDLCGACAKPRESHDIRNCWAKSKTCYHCNKTGHIKLACNKNITGRQ